MNAKQWMIPMVAATLTAYAHTAAAECEEREAHFVESGYGYLLQAGNDHNQGRGNDNKHGNGNENSNRQSDPDSTRGLARAEERRGDKDKHDAQERRRWYNPFGWKPPSEWFD